MDEEKKYFAQELIKDLYEEGYLMTLWNSAEGRRKQGWILKNNMWSPWFLNMRPLGSSPKLFYRICSAMAELVMDFASDVNFMVGVEMAGIPFVAAVSTILCQKYGKTMPFGYTRPLFPKPRNLQEVTASLDNSGSAYGQKDLVEGRIENSCHIAIVDDMATDLGSKEIARFLVLESARRKGITVACDHVFYLLNRNQANQAKAGNLRLHYIIEFDDVLPKLGGVMQDKEYKAIMAYQQSPAQFQNKQVQQELLRQAAE